MIREERDGSSTFLTLNGQKVVEITDEGDLMLLPEVNICRLGKRGSVAFTDGLADNWVFTFSKGRCTSVTKNGLEQLS